MMLDPRGAFMMAFLKSQEVKIAHKEHFERMASAANGAEARGALRDTDIGSYLEGTTPRGPRQLDQVLWRYWAEKIEFLKSHRFFPAPARRFCQVHQLKYDVTNVKAALLGLSMGRKPWLIPIGEIHAQGRLEDLENAQAVPEISEILLRTGLHELETPMRNANPAGGAKARLAVEAALEGEYHAQLLKTARSMPGGEILAKSCALVIDLTNLSILCRALMSGIGSGAIDFFIPGGWLLDRKTFREALSNQLQDVPRRFEDPLCRQVATEIVSVSETTSSVAVSDEIVERHKLSALRGLLSPQTAPASVMAWYLLLKEIELRNVRLLLQAVEDGLAFAEVRKHLLS